MTIEEAFKAGWNSHSDPDDQSATADKAWIDFRFQQIRKERGLEAAQEYIKHATDALSAKKEESKIEDLKCPDCGGLMVSRTNRESGNRFWGCRTYPKCKGTRDVNGLSKQDKRQRQDDNDEVDDPIRWDRNS